jgi:ATP-dependent DNA ligase
VLYAFDLLMLRGEDVRFWPLEERRAQLREIIPTLPDTIRDSETFNVPLSELIRAVKKHQLEGIVGQARPQPISLRAAMRRLAKVAGQSWAGVRYRRLHS